MLSQNCLTFMVADDHPLFRKGLVDFLHTHYYGCSVHETANGKELCEACLQHSYDIILVDVKMPEMNGPSAARLITHQNPRAKIIAISMYDDETHMIDMFENGATGYLAKTSGEKEITETIENVLQGCCYVAGKKMDELLNRKILEWRKRGANAITGREKEVLLLLCEGFSSKEIATRLYLSIKTVENHRSHLLEKTHVRNTAGLIVYAMRKGWI